jgi:hypothetical protein
VLSWIGTRARAHGCGFACVTQDLGPLLEELKAREALEAQEDLGGPLLNEIAEREKAQPRGLSFLLD